MPVSHFHFLLCLLLLVAPLFGAQDPNLTDRAKRTLSEMEAEMAEAAAELAKAEARFEQALTEARIDAVRDLERLADREKDFVVKAAIYKHALAILPTDATASREFFTAIGTLDQMLAEIAADNPVPQAAGVDLLAMSPAAAGAYDPLEQPVVGQALSDLDPLRVQVGWGQLARGSTLPGGQGAMMVHDVTLEKGIVAHPAPNGNSEVDFPVPAGAQVLVGGCAIADRFEPSTQTPLTFIIRDGQRELWRSPAIAAGERALVPFRVPVAGLGQLTFEVQCPGRFGNAMAVWVNPSYR